MSSRLTGPGAVAVAMALDEWLGEPPAAAHPVVAMGRYLNAVAPWIPAEPHGRAALTGALGWAGGMAGSTAAALLAARLTRRLPWPVAALLQGTVLWSLLSAKLLRDEVAGVEQALTRSLADGRRRVSRLVSRDAQALDAVQVREAALGSLSENLSDSVVAPLLAHAVGGLPAAAAYRFINTADAMWGYRMPRWRSAGYVAARADDVANLVPARLTGLLLLGPARLSDGGLARLRRHARATPSPNGGWPMGALALRLGIRLSKPGVYDLNPEGRAATADDTRAALRLTCMITGVGAVVAAVLAITVGGLGRRGRS